jgi:hypothetical protein
MIERGQGKAFSFCTPTSSHGFSLRLALPNIDGCPLHAGRFTCNFRGARSARPTAAENQKIAAISRLIHFMMIALV